MMIDTHIWIWWVHGDAQLTPEQQELLRYHEATGIGREPDFEAWKNFVEAHL